MVPVGGGYAEATVLWRSGEGALLRGELGHRFTTNLGAFGFVQSNLRDTMAGGGLRMQW